MSLDQTTANREPGKTHSNWFRRAFIGMLLAAAMAIFVTSKYSATLVVAESAATPAEFVLLTDTEIGQSVRVAADRVIAGSIEGILLAAEERTRVVTIGAVPANDILARETLQREGVAAESISVLPGIRPNDWQTARGLNEWMIDHPEKRVRVLCDHFASRRYSLIYDNVLSPANRTNVFVEGIPDTRYDVANWWKRRSGIKSFLFNLFRLEYARWHGEDPKPVVDWSADKYEASVIKGIR